MINSSTIVVSQTAIPCSLFLKSIHHFLSVGPHIAYKSFRIWSQKINQFLIQPEVDCLVLSAKLRESKNVACKKNCSKKGLCLEEAALINHVRKPGFETRTPCGQYVGSPDVARAAC